MQCEGTLLLPGNISTRPSLGPRCVQSSRTSALPNRSDVRRGRWHAKLLWAYQPACSFFFARAPCPCIGQGEKFGFCILRLTALSVVVCGAQRCKRHPRRASCSGYENRVTRATRAPLFGYLPRKEAPAGDCRILRLECLNALPMALSPACRCGYN